MRRPAVTAILLLACAIANATPAAWPIDGAHSSARFSVRTLWFTHERGRFDGVHGEMRRNQAGRDVVDAWIDADSLSMDDPDALAQARGPNFFDAARYPRIHFVSSAFAPAMLSDGGTLDGILDLHGQRRWVQFTLLASACPAQPLTCPVRVHGTLSRSAFGMRAHRGLLSDKVVL
ncbi:MAG TPA: YceI family protein, partial [Rhodanobacteraceae bacterium]|nr:YceI family protein [Rhodanobacteraceae bacterium]